MRAWGTSALFAMLSGMYIRRKKNRGGSVSIQIAEKVSGKVRIVQTMGVAQDDEEEQSLRQKAKVWLDQHRGQHTFQLPDTQDKIIEGFLKADTSPVVTNVGPELILGQLFDQMSFNKIPEPLFRAITLSRLVYPVSKLKTTHYLRQHHGVEVSISGVYRFLDRFYKHHKDEVEQIVYEYSCRVLGTLHIVFYDMTTLYFETDDEDDLRKIGFSKDGKINHPQILLGLMVGKEGYPIGYDLFEGNCFEGRTLIPMIQRLEAKFNLPKPIVIADSGLLSKHNLQMLEEQGYQYILGARIKVGSDELKQAILAQTRGLQDKQAVVIDHEAVHNTLIVSYSQRRAKKDCFNREKGITRLKKTLSSGKLTKQQINNRGYNKFLTLENEVSISLNQALIEADSHWDGLKGYTTNTQLPIDEVIQAYNELWKIEKAFRISKTDLRIRPIFHHKKRRIEAHLCIAYAAYAIYKELERRLVESNLELSAARAIELSKTIFRITYQLPESGKTISTFNQLSDDQKALLNLLGVPQ